MPPMPFDFSGLQPFKTIRNNWGTIKPYHDNVTATIQFFTIAFAFLGMAAMIIKHGFKMPRLHPLMEVEDLEPSKLLEHPNEFVKVEDLAEAKLWTLEQKFEAAQMWEDKMREQAATEVTTNDDRQEDSVDTDIQAAEERFKESAQAGVENAMDVLDDEGSFDVKTE
jgi:hypothetical protein